MGEYAGKYAIDIVAVQKSSWLLVMKKQQVLPYLLTIISLAVVQLIKMKLDGKYTSKICLLS